MSKLKKISDLKYKDTTHINTHIPKNKLIIFDCVDKKHNEKWTPSRSLINKPRPYRCALIAPPNSGKSSLMKNIILHASPEYSKIFVWANSASNEWSDYADVMLSSDDILNDDGTLFTTDIEGHRLLIIEDIELQHTQKKLKEKVALLFKHISSHYQLTILVAVQEYKMITPDIRSNLNVFCINLNIRDIESIANLGKKIGVSYKQFKSMFTKLKNIVENKQYSYVVVDNTINAPAPLSINFFEELDIDKMLAE